MAITFLLNGTPVTLVAPNPAQTALDWLREERGLTGTKEGCNEGDCGACTVIVTEPGGPPKALNACILMLPQLHGKALRTVEGISGPAGELHPVQQAMIDHHGSQCGFCTPGFIASMAAAHSTGRQDHAETLAGNLCRCTGYAPILRAAKDAASAPVPGWMHDQPQVPEAPAETSKEAGWALPTSSDALAALYAARPEAQLVAGATDVGLWVTKGLRDLPFTIFLDGCADLKGVSITDDTIRIRAMTDMETLRHAIAPHHPAYAELIRRYGSMQVRNAATIGGNIANGSPIGDNPPPLIALGATLHLRHGDTRRILPIEDFFLDYGKQDRAPGEFVEAITIPRDTAPLKVWKISKRFDQDISALCGAFCIRVESGIVTSARIAFGGMAAIPKRAKATEAALTGQPWTAATVEAAAAHLETDFTPIDDMRASARYRLAMAAALLRRCLDGDGAAAHVLEVAP